MTALISPTSRLPPIGQLAYYSTEELAAAIRYLRQIYNPEVRGIRRLSKKSGNGRVPTAQSAVSEDHLDAIRSDAFERSYAIRWLTSLVSQAYRFGELPSDIEPSPREVLIQEAASLLAISAGTASAGTLTRTFHFPRTGGAVEVQLTDAPLDNHDYGSVGAQTWGSACLLSEMLVDEPHKFGLLPAPHAGSTRLRALELGAGTGLVTSTLAKVCMGDNINGSNAIPAEIIATDFHASVLANLRNNIEANCAAQSAPTDAAVSVSCSRLDWSQFPSANKHEPPFDKPFNLILGADIVYEAEHATWIKACVERLLKMPSSYDCDPLSSTPRFHLVIPLRSTHVLECSTIEEVFPAASRIAAGEAQASTPVLAILSKDVIVCEAYDDVRSRRGGSDNVEYVHYVIGWCV
ncbi:hypothetical protein OBBRIDRAFT_508974 [Obba rivulosa]|uniref:Uncharacterized protein n=1 Tax=Obba rivulosa TaxID=1052685 RepID=A0A8E2B4T0_9APHY|nr:hypothetical protein OBBRIDRAFT_508974 [Obba rivulosa]